MTIIDYRRSALTVIQVASTPADELLRFLRDRGQGYDLMSAGGREGVPVVLRNRRTGELLRIPTSSYLVWDPDYQTVEIYGSARDLRAIGVNPDRIISMLHNSEPDWMNLD